MRGAEAQAAPLRSRRPAPSLPANGLSAPAPDDAGPAPWRNAAAWWMASVVAGGLRAGPG